MKRGMVGGAYRGPVGVGRQRRTIRLMQGVLVLAAAGLLLFAGYSLGTDGSASQVVVLAILGLGAFGAALGLQTEGGVRLLTPARLRDMEQAGGEPIELADETPDEESLPT